MGEVIVVSTVLDIGLALVALALLWGVFRLLDRAAGRDWYEVSSTILHEPLAAAVYYGLRFIGAATLMGLLLG
ncbi:hypothetical protein [Arhodomonas sp. AD133]|uniref:hypothetical protein n=1 Tax=Arhodomonas sp. AD133 TaxID=3415009 RepID=UPI003EB95F35